MSTRFIPSLPAVVLVCASASLSAQTIISINMNENNGREGMVASDLAGVKDDNVRVNNWNEIRAQNNFTLEGADTVYDDGSTVGGSFEAVLTTDRGTFDDQAVTINDPQMYRGSNQIWDGESLSISLTGIPFSNYDIYVYTVGGNSGRGGSISLSGGTTYYNRGDTRPDANGDGYVLITTTTYDSENPSAVGAGNYVLYSGLSGASQTFSLSALNMGDVNQRQELNGFQIVQVPEPGAYALLLGCASLLLIIKRRQHQ